MKDHQTAKPLTLKCGLTLPNRLVRAAVAESIVTKDMLPDEKFQNLYRHWADGGWGMVITGNVQVDATHICTWGDLAVDQSLADDRIIAAWTPWAEVCSKNGTPTILQLCHPGRQSPMGAGKRGYLAKSIAPSPVPLDMGSGLFARAITKILFGTPREMTVAEIETVVQQFARAARLAAQSGFAGVEIHAGHGFLLDQFLTAETNRRTDEYGNKAAGRAKIVLDIIKAIRTDPEVPADFAVGVTVNSVEFRSHLLFEFKDLIVQLNLMIEAGIDFIEVTGGSFENPTMFLGTKTRGAYFIDFVKALREQNLDIPMMITGGFRNYYDIEYEIATGACELVGLARPAVVNPLLPKAIIFNPEVDNEEKTFHTEKTEAPWAMKQLGVKAVEVHVDNAWYVERLTKMAHEKS